MSCALEADTRPLSSRQWSILTALASTTDPMPARTSADLRARFTNIATTRAELAVLVERSLVLPVTSWEPSTRSRDGASWSIAWFDCDPDAVRVEPLRWRLSSSGRRRVERRSARWVAAGPRTTAPIDMWYCRRGADMRAVACRRLRNAERPTSPRPSAASTLDEVVFELTAVMSCDEAYRSVSQPWRELYGATPAVVLGENPGRAPMVLAAAQTRVAAAMETQQRREASSDELRALAARVSRLAAAKWGGHVLGERQWCCGPIAMRTARPAA